MEQNKNTPVVRLPSWSFSPKTNEQIVLGKDLPPELQKYFFGIIEFEHHLSNLPKDFALYTRAIINEIFMYIPILEALDPESSKHDPNLNIDPTFFINEVNLLNVEPKGISKTYRGIEGFTMMELNTQRSKDWTEFSQRMEKQGRIFKRSFDASGGEKPN